MAQLMKLAIIKGDLNGMGMTRENKTLANGSF